MEYSSYLAGIIIFTFIVIIIAVGIAANSSRSSLPQCDAEGFLTADVVNRKSTYTNPPTYTVVKNVIFSDFQGLNQTQLQNVINSSLGPNDPKVDVRGTFDQLWTVPGGEGELVVPFFNPVSGEFVNETEHIKLCRHGKFEYAYVTLLKSEPTGKSSIPPLPPLTVAGITTAVSSLLGISLPATQLVESSPPLSANNSLPPISNPPLTTTTICL